jgi:hypothetical protein
LVHVPDGRDAWQTVNPPTRLACSISTRPCPSGKKLLTVTDSGLSPEMTETADPGLAAQDDGPSYPAEGRSLVIAHDSAGRDSLKPTPQDPRQAISSSPFCAGQPLACATRAPFVLW